MIRRQACLLLVLLVLVGGVLHAAVVSAPSLYNEGNAHARAHEWGLAALHYQRARLLAPDDPDVQANLQYVQSAAKADSSTPSFLQRLTRLTSPDVAAGLGLSGLVLLGSAWLCRRWARLLAAVCGALLVGWAAAYAEGLRPLLHGGVVMSATHVQASPVPMADALLAVPEATTVVILDERPDYLLVRLPSGQSGWMPRSHLAAVVPAEP